MFVTLSGIIIDCKAVQERKELLPIDSRLFGSSTDDKPLLKKEYLSISFTPAGTLIADKPRQRTHGAVLQRL